MGQDRRVDLAAPACFCCSSIASGGIIQYAENKFTGRNGDFALAGPVSAGVAQARVGGSTVGEVLRIGAGGRLPKRTPG